MLQRIEVKSEAEKEAILTNKISQGGVLVEDQRHFEGHFLVFEMPDIFTELADLKKALPRDLTHDLEVLRERVNLIEEGRASAI